MEQADDTKHITKGSFREKKWSAGHHLKSLKTEEDK